MNVFSHNSDVHNLVIQKLVKVLKNHCVNLLIIDEIQVVSNNTPKQSPKRRLRKHEEFAVYQDAKVPQYQGNPVIKALPLSLSKPALMRYFLGCPQYSEDQRTWSVGFRLQMILQALRLFTLSDTHCYLAWQVDGATHLSYEKRSPLDTDFWNKIEQDVDSINSICCGQGTSNN
ncbi:hypothetical protein [Phormidesmis sp. 146-33]